MTVRDSRKKNQIGGILRVRKIVRRVPPPKKVSLASRITNTARKLTAKRAQNISVKRDIQIAKTIKSSKSRTTIVKRAATAVLKRVKKGPMRVARTVKSTYKKIPSASQLRTKAIDGIKALQKKIIERKVTSSINRLSDLVARAETQKMITVLHKVLQSGELSKRRDGITVSSEQIAIKNSSGVTSSSDVQPRYNAAQYKQIIDNIRPPRDPGNPVNVANRIVSLSASLVDFSDLRIEPPNIRNSRSLAESAKTNAAEAIKQAGITDGIKQTSMTALELALPPPSLRSRAEMNLSNGTRAQENTVSHSSSRVLAALSIEAPLRRSTAANIERVAAANDAITYTRGEAAAATAADAARVSRETISSANDATITAIKNADEKLLVKADSDRAAALQDVSRARTELTDSIKNTGDTQALVDNTVNSVKTTSTELDVSLQALGDSIRVEGNARATIDSSIQARDALVRDRDALITQRDNIKANVDTLLLDDPNRKMILNQIGDITKNIKNIEESIKRVNISLEVSNANLLAETTALSDAKLTIDKLNEANLATLQDNITLQNLKGTSEINQAAYNASGTKVSETLTPQIKEFNNKQRTKDALENYLKTKLKIKEFLGAKYETMTFADIINALSSAKGTEEPIFARLRGTTEGDGPARLNNDATNAGINSLLDGLTGLKNDMNRVDTNITDLTGTIRNAEGEMANLNTERTAIETATETAAAKAEADALAADNSLNSANNLDPSINAAQNSLNTISETVNGLKNELGPGIEKADAIKNNLAENAAATDAAARSAESARLANNNAEANARSADSDAQQLAAKEGDAADAADAAAAQRDNLPLPEGADGNVLDTVNKLENVSDNIKTNIDEMNAAKKILEEAEANLKKSLKESEDLSNSIETADKALENANAAKEATMIREQEARDAIDAANRRLEELDAEHLSLSEKLAQEEGIMNSLGKDHPDFNDLFSRLQRIKNELAAKQGEINRAKTEIEEAERLLKAAEKDIEDLNTGIKDLEGRKQSLLDEQEILKTKREAEEEKANKIRDRITYLSGLITTGMILYGIINDILNKIRGIINNRNAPAPAPPENEIIVPPSQDTISGPIVTGASGSVGTSNLTSGPIKGEILPEIYMDIGCRLGTKDYLRGCKDGINKGTADGTTDGARDQIEHAKRILPFTDTEIKNYVDINISHFKPIEKEAYCAQVEMEAMNANISMEDIDKMYPDCKTDKPSYGQKKSYGDPYGEFHGEAKNDPYGEFHGEAKNDPYGEFHGEAKNDPYGEFHGEAKSDPYGEFHGEAKSDPYGEFHGEAYGPSYGENRPQTPPAVGGAIQDIRNETADYLKGYAEGYRESYLRWFQTSWILSKSRSMRPPPIASQIYTPQSNGEPSTGGGKSSLRDTKHIKDIRAHIKRAPSKRYLSQIKRIKGKTNPE